MAIFNSYVSLPEGISWLIRCCNPTQMKRSHILTLVAGTLEGFSIRILSNSNTGLITPPQKVGGYLLASFLDHPLIISNSEP